MSAFGRLLSNSRFYILAFLAFLSLSLVGYARIHAASEQQFYTWLHVGGFVLLAILFIFVAIGVTNLLAKKVADLRTQKELWVTVCLCVWLFFVGLLLFLPGTSGSQANPDPEKPMDMEMHHE